jgi:glycosyltransferase involved in cell wall biosynthesis
MRALLGPTNFAGQPVALMRALRARGVDAHHVLYDWRKGGGFAYDTDRVVTLDRRSWPSAQLGVLDGALDEGFDVFHLWNRSLICPPGEIGVLHGLDLPFLRASGARIVYRFTGYDLRRRSLDMELNPYSPFHAGFTMPTDERVQSEYIEHLRSWVDCFVVQDPEMQAFLPEAEVIPRGIDLSRYPYAEPEPRDVPLVVHAPSNPGVKGTAHVERAVQFLRDRGLRFEFTLITGMSHEQALAVYRRADIVIDQLLIGWYGVLALEGMALGKPVIAYVREPLFSDFRPPLPIVNASPMDLADRLAELIVDPALRAERGQRGREFVEQVHDIRRVAEQTHALYERLSCADRARARPSARYLAALAPELEAILVHAEGYQRWAGELPELRRKAQRYDEHAADLPELRSKAKQLDRLLPELRELRARAEARDATPTLAALGPIDESTEARLSDRLAALDRRARAFRRTRARLDAAEDPASEDRY